MPVTDHEAGTPELLSRTAGGQERADCHDRAPHRIDCVRQRAGNPYPYWQAHEQREYRNERTDD
jgi:hypothetical protein